MRTFRPTLPARSLLVAMAAAALAAAPVPPSATELPALLSRLAEHSARVRALSQSGVTVLTRTELLDGKGAVESRTEAVDRRFVRGGEEIVELRRFVRDGQDETAQEKARRAERKAKAGEGKERSMSFTLSSPFSAEASARHTFSLAGADSQDPSLTRIAFQPKGSASPETFKGEAGVDPATGTVRWIRFRPAKNPKHVTRMEVTMLYGLETPGGPALSRVSVDGEGGILFVKKGYRSESTFSDYGGGSAP